MDTLLHVGLGNAVLATLLALVALAASLFCRRRPALVLTITQGKAGQRVYSFDSHDRIMLGRLDEVLDEEGRVKRRNDVAFLEEGEVNRTVSREQARILWDAESAEYRLRTEPGASGTRILRDGRTIDVTIPDLARG